EITARKIRLLEPDHALLGVPGDGGNDVIVAKARWSNDREFRDTLALRLDTLSGITHPLSAPPDANVTEWMLDEHGEPRAALDTRGAHARLFWRAPGKAGWELLDDSPTAIGQPRYRPLWNEGGTLYVTAASGKDQTAALYRYETTKRSLDPQALFSTTGFDYDGWHVFDQASGRVVGIRYQSDAAGSYWFDTRLQAAQREIDALLPGTVNRLICLRCTDAARLLISAASDRQPAVYYLFDTKTRKLEAIGSSRPWIDARQMATQDFVRIEARDGLSLPIYVTRPPGKSDAPRPAVVLVHGGPQVRGNVWGWQPITQFLASRGYVVIEPEFRGGNGFGFAHLSAGFRQWGRAMQDDVTDATHWAIRSAGIDPKRICIAGASYGGYAALMGLLREPDLYRCGFEWVGVTDLELMFSIPYSDLPEDWKQHGLQIMLGDPERDKEAMRAVSPLMQAEHIKQPLLLAYGGRDRRVPLTHGVQFHDAVRRSNRDVEWVVYPEEAHGWGALETNRDFWTRVENFLARNIGAATDTAARR
ncbi:MAG TPA: prolyl oligopeptidase family serine peptidase, partial [Methylibium sp.]